MTKHFYDNVYLEGHAFGYDGGPKGMPNRTRMLWERTSIWLASFGLNANPDAKILEIGCGMAYLSKIHPGWHGAEYSRSAVDRVKASESETRIFLEDAQTLSFLDKSFDAVFTYATLEHVPDPDRAFREIDRILREGGQALIAPAWNCREWTVKKIEKRSMADLTLTEKLERLSIPLREHIIFRAMIAFPKRFFTELVMWLLPNRPLPLRYSSLHPRWDLIDKYGHVSDDDAVADIDPHAGIAFFKTRGYAVISHQTLYKRMTARHEPIIVRKPNLSGSKRI